METLQIVAAVAGGIGGVVNAAWYMKSKNGGHLFMAIAMLLVAVIFGYLAAT
jgi:hypothetical protein